MAKKIKFARLDINRLNEISSSRKQINFTYTDKDFQNMGWHKNLYWVAIRTKDLVRARAMERTEKVFDKWIQWKNKQTKPINIYGIGLNYSYSSKTTIIGNNHSVGEILYIEPFKKEPSLRNGKYLFFIEEPKLRKATFDPASRYYPGEDEKTEVLSYNNIVSLYIDTHRIPDYTLDFHNYAVFEVNIYDEDDNLMTDQALVYHQKTRENKYSVDIPNVLDIKIDPKWKEKNSHSDGIKSYYAKVKTTIYSNRDAKLGIRQESYNNPNNYYSLTTFASTAPNTQGVMIDINEEDRGSNQNIEQIKANARKYSSKIFDHGHGGDDWYNTRDQLGEIGTFKVRATDINEDFEEQKTSQTNMIVAVGDVSYTHKNDEPCKFSKIIFSQKDRDPITIFDEDATDNSLLDNTVIPIEIVAGSDKQTLNIKTKGLQTIFHKNGAENIYCEGKTFAVKNKNGKFILKKKKHAVSKSGFQHDGIDKVFNLEYAFMLFPDKMDSPGRASGTSTGNENLDIARQNIEFEHKKDSIDISLGYAYNTSLSPKTRRWMEDYGVDWAGDLVENLWLIKYYLLNKDNAQSYFIPVATCRYPNQMVLINVYPKVAWAVYFSIGKKEDKVLEEWRKDLSEEKKKLIAEKTDQIREYYPKKYSNWLKKRENKNADKKEKESKKNLNLKISIKASYDNKTVDFTSGLGDNIYNLVNNFLVLKEWIEDVTGSGKSEKDQRVLYKERINKLAKKKGSKWLSKLSKTPATIEVSNPEISIGVAWERKAYKDRSNATAPIAYDIFIEAKPLFAFKGSIDLITCATFIPVAGQVIKVADIVLNVVGVEPKLELFAKGKVNLKGMASIQHDKNSSNNNIDVHVDAGAYIGIEASVTLGSGLVGFMFSGGDIAALTSDQTYSATAEAGLEFDAGIGINSANGVYIDFEVSFTGLVAVGKKETGKNRMTGSSEELFRYEIIKPKKPIFGDRYYYNDKK